MKEWMWYVTTTIAAILLVISPAMICFGYLYVIEGITKVFSGKADVYDKVIFITVMSIVLSPLVNISMTLTLYITHQVYKLYKEKKEHKKWMNKKLSKI